MDCTSLKLTVGAPKTHRFGRLDRELTQDLWPLTQVQRSPIPRPQTHLNKMDKIRPGQAFTCLIPKKALPAATDHRLLARKLHQLNVRVCFLEPGAFCLESRDV